MAAGSYCPKCNGRMEEGFIPDYGYGEKHAAGWHPGTPNKKWWGLKVDRKVMRRIESFRCTKCGYLENYAK